MRTLFVVLLIVVAGTFASRDLRSCGSCGMECENACGTRNFKTCCFNYMRKRSELSAGGGGGAGGGGMPLPAPELWLAHGKSPLLLRMLLQKAAAYEQSRQLADAYESAQAQPIGVQ